MAFAQAKGVIPRHEMALALALILHARGLVWGLIGGKSSGRVAACKRCSLAL